MRIGRTRCNRIVTSGFSETTTFSEDLLVGPLKGKACLDSLAAGWTLGYPTPVLESPYLHMCACTHTHTHSPAGGTQRYILCILQPSRWPNRSGWPRRHLSTPGGALRLCCEPQGFPLLHFSWQWWEGVWSEVDGTGSLCCLRASSSRAHGPSRPPGQAGEAQSSLGCWWVSGAGRDLHTS